MIGFAYFNYLDNRFKIYKFKDYFNDFLHFEYHFKRNIFAYFSAFNKVPINYPTKREHHCNVIFQTTRPSFTHTKFRKNLASIILSKKFVINFENM